MSVSAALPEHIIAAYERFRAGNHLNGDLIACLAAILLFVTGLYTEAVLLLILTYLISFAEKKFSESSNATQEAIHGIIPSSAALVTDNGLERVDPSAVNPGDIIFVAAGERIPLDGVVTEGITTIDTASVSGQRSPWAVNVGYKVYSGCRGCVALEFKAFNSKGNRGISCRLLGVQKIRDGEPLGRTFNGAAAFQVFKPAEVSADENDFLK